MSSTENPWHDVIGLEQENVPTAASASENRERRVARDGVAYTHDEFIEHYGMERGTEMWGEAADRNREQFILPVDWVYCACPRVCFNKLPPREVAAGIIFCDFCYMEPPPIHNHAIFCDGPQPCFSARNAPPCDCGDPRCCTGTHIPFRARRNR